MKCPHCEYIDGWDAKKMDSINGDKGDFYRLPIRMERRDGWDDDYAKVFACPKCKKTFIDEFA